MNRSNPKVDEYFAKIRKWRDELIELRKIILDCGLTEELKWNNPCYTFKKANVVIIGELNNCCILSFFKGALLKDTENILSKPGENTQSARIVRFTDVQEIKALEPTLKAYIFEAVEAEKAGLKVEFRKNPEPALPEELQRKMEKIPALKTAFESLTPGRQKAYILYFSAPKQSKTREARIEKYVQRILSGKGLNDW